MNGGEYFGRERVIQMLIDHTDHRTLKRGTTGEHEPESCPERVDIRPDVDLFFLQLFRAGKMGGSDKSSHRYGQGLIGGSHQRLGQPEVDYLHQQMILFLIHHQHDIRRLDIAMHQFLAVRGNQGPGNLSSNSKSQFRWQGAFPLEAALNGLALHVLHRVVKPSFGITEMKNRRHIWMPKTGGGSGLPEKTLARRFAV